ncbi:MAG: tetratricopeptide repeat protein, partial [Nitrospinae bacterium]|nr:tetratricopeptide repeat protein [Nitrospinota bacterium]
VESDAYGNRYLIPGALLFTLGLGNLLHRCFANKIARGVSLAFVALCVTVQYLMIVQYKVVLPYNHPRFSLEAMSGAARVLFDQPLLLLRSTNFFRVLGFDNGGWNFTDAMYLVIFPLMQLLCVVGVVWLLGRGVKNSSVTDFLIRPRNVIVGTALASLVLIGIVGVTAPDKAAGEIEKRMMYKTLLADGDSFLAAGSLGAAQGAFEKASALMPKSWVAHFKLGIIWGAQKNFNRAKLHYGLGLSVYPDHPALLANYGATLVVMGEFQEAEPLLRQAVRLWPTNPNSYNSLAQMYLRQNRHEEARRMLLLAVAVSPNFGTGHANLALLYVMMNQPALAKEHLQRALGLGIKNSMTDNLQQVLQNLPAKP